MHLHTEHKNYGTTHTNPCNMQHLALLLLHSFFRLAYFSISHKKNSTSVRNRKQHSFQSTLVVYNYLSCSTEKGTIQRHRNNPQSTIYNAFSRYISSHKIVFQEMKIGVKSQTKISATLFDVLICV